MITDAGSRLKTSFSHSRVRQFEKMSKNKWTLTNLNMLQEDTRNLDTQL